MFREWGAPASVNLTCAYGNAGGDEIIGTNILYEDPLFCNMYADDFRLCSNSVCRAANNEWHFLFGATSFYCGTCEAGVEETSWGSIKAMFRP